ncbi:hypothetical protein TNCV_3662761 [Trichonephila clavipes]|nr:hypothetical protein TNCV_3662761 [Trichonephila clavipes]
MPYFRVRKSAVDLKAHQNRKIELLSDQLSQLRIRRYQPSQKSSHQTVSALILHVRCNYSSADLKGLEMRYNQELIILCGVPLRLETAWTTWGSYYTGLHYRIMDREAIPLVAGPL